MGDTTMNEQWMPTTAQVRDSYGAGVHDGWDFHPKRPLRDTDVEFDTWLRAHDAEVAANALREAAQHIEEQWPVDGGERLRSGQWPDEYLTTRADRIEREATNR